MALDTRKHTVPTGGDAPSRAAIVAGFESVNDIVPVADTTERAAVATAIAPTVARPLFVWRADAADREQLEVTTDGTTWNSIRIGESAGKMWRTGTSQDLTTSLAKVAMNNSRVAGGVTFDDANDQLVLNRDGIWQVIVQGYVTGGSGYIGYFAAARTRSAVADALIPTPTFNKTAGSSDERATTTQELPLQAGDRLSLQVVSSVAAGQALGFTEYQGCSLTVTYIRPLNGAAPI